MKEIAFDVRLQAGDLYRFTMRHTYYSVGGVFSLLLSFGCLAFCCVRFRELAPSTLGVLLVVAALFTVIQPVMLYVKCRMQIKRSKDIKDALTYVLGEEGITVRQEEQEVLVHWYDIRKVVYGGSGIYIYLSPVRAFIFPREACGEQYGAIRERVAEMYRKYRDYIPEEEEPEKALEDGEHGQ